MAKPEIALLSKTVKRTLDDIHILETGRDLQRAIGAAAVYQ
ncbi:hypothetical protein BN1012_Phect869 [Candidatus Phaeomarinobacter ectocarpi]|uniref:Uncharacterized protein n=1 Tax=Candidatus Phaeomarinibacter ectocarpi TaxID=1458461 RepID=X5M7G0_9HYPH|nr:hypothetical protein BN1012_Phect869 [Candidatus Phaeomarinobacter ectocarpi]